MPTVEDLKLATAENLRWASRDLTEFFSAYAGADPRDLRDALLDFYPDLVRVYGDQGAALAAEFYDDARATARVSGSYRSQLAPALPAEQAVGSARWAVGPAFDDDWDTALQNLIGASERLIQQAARDTMSWNVDRDQHAVGWRRNTRPESCQFCRMLAGRGGVYSKKSVFFASHDWCKCTVTPAWDAHAKPVPVELYKLSARTSRMNPDQLEKHRTRVRAYLLANKDYLT